MSPRASAMLFVSACACGPTLHNDGFRTGPLQKGCATEEECRALIDEAKRRWSVCEEAPVASCKDAYADWDASIAWQQRMRRTNEERDRAKHQAEGERQAEEHRQRVAVAEEKRRQDNEIADRHAASSQGLMSCKGGNTEACTALVEADRERCASECAAFIAEQRERVFKSARKQCAGAFADGAKSSVCEFDGHGNADAWLPRDRQRECDAACLDLGKRLRAYEATHAKCCDGTRSPTCTYGNLRSGCCSSHRGVCEEAAPE